MFRKFIYVCIARFSFSFLILLSHDNFSLFLYLSYLPFLADYLAFNSLNFLLDYEFFIFFFMVNIVTFFVCKFSSLYIDFYNLKKFFFLLFSFYLRIVFLRCGGSVINLIIGWDSLGISSLLLIIFYPNKNTLFNSFLTSFFNRVGDLILISIFCLILFIPHFFFFLLQDNFYAFVLILLVCSFTKRAQFPISSWLPAAISAPTPISAIVHSSTLVTAGVFLLVKIHEYIIFNNLFFFLGAFRIFTFLVGGLLRNLEFDLKKIVAFSTISQIRIMIFFSSYFILSFCLCHIIYHAFFKTLLFRACGVLFLFFFRSQKKKFLFNERISPLFLFFLFRIFPMTGLVFSSSFYRKDLFIEILILEKRIFYFFFIFIGRIFTIRYCCKILYPLIRICNFNPILISKKFFFGASIFFSLVRLVLIIFFKILFPLDSFPSTRFLRVLMLSLALFLSIFFNLTAKKKFFLYLPLEILFIKSVFFREAINFFSKAIDQWSDVGVFKPGNILRHFNGPTVDAIRASTIVHIFCLFLSILIYSISLKNVALKLLKCKNNSKIQNWKFCVFIPTPSN